MNGRKNQRVEVMDPTKIQMLEEGVLAFISAGVLKPRKNAVVESMFLASLKEMDNEEEEEEEEVKKPTFRIKKDQDEYELEQAIKTVMKKFSKSTHNCISAKTFYEMLSQLIDDIDMETCEDWIKEYDEDSNGIIHLTEFIQLILGKLIKIRIDDTEEQVIKAFKVFDLEETGFVEATEMRNILLHLGDKLNDEEVNQFMKKADIDGDGFINYEEFTKLMFSTNKKPTKVYQY